MANICLVAVLGTGILCSGGERQKTASDFCQAAGPQISRLGGMSEAEISALSRQHKEAIVSLKRTKKKLCP